MIKPFNALQTKMIEALTEALFHDVHMAISPNQVAANLQKHFSRIDGGKPKEMG